MIQIAIADDDAAFLAKIEKYVRKDVYKRQGIWRLQCKRGKDDFRKREDRCGHLRY